MKKQDSSVRPALNPERTDRPAPAPRPPAAQTPPPEPPPLEEIPLESLPLDDLPKSATPSRAAQKVRKSEPPAPPPAHVEREAPLEPLPPSGGGKKAALIGAALFSVFAVVAVAAVGGVLLVRGGKKDPQPEPAAASQPVDDGGASAPPERYTFKPEEIAERLIPSTVLVTPDKGINSLGSGVLVNRDPHVVLTNWHVVEKARNKSVLVFFPEFDSRKQLVSQVAHYQNKAELLGIPAKIIHADRDRDIAMLELSRVPDTAVPVSLAPGSAKQLERVYGNGQSGVDFSALWQSNEGSCRQLVDLPFAEGTPGTSRVLLTSQPINPGDSGGPVVNAQLELVGIVQAKASKYLRVLEKSVKVEGLDNFSLVVDIEELRAHLNDGFRLAYKRSFPEPSNQFARGAGASGASAAARKPKPRTAEELVRVLSFGASEQAPQAMRELREVGTAAVPLLIEMLRNDDQRGNWPKALEALERIDNPAASAPAAEVAIRCLKDDDKKTKIETKIAAAKFLRAVNPHGKEDALPVLWNVLAINNLRLRNEARDTIRAYGPYSSKDIDRLQRLAGLGRPDSTTNPFVKAFYIVLLSEMDDLRQADFSQHVDALNVFTDQDHRLRAFIADVLIEKPGKFSRRDRLRCFIPLLGDTEERVTRNAREALEDMTWLVSREPEVTYRDFELSPQRRLEAGYWVLEVDGKPVRIQQKVLYNSNKEPLLDPDGNQNLLPIGYGYAKEWELVSKDFSFWITLTQKSASGKETKERKQQTVKISRLRKVTEDDVDVLVNILNDKSTPTDGQIYALDMLLSVELSAPVKVSRLSSLLSEVHSDNTQKDRNLGVILRVLQLMLHQKKPVDVGPELLKLCHHKQQNIRGLALLCLSLVSDRELEQEILKAIYDALDDDNAAVRVDGRKAMGYCLQVREDRFVDEIRLSQTALATARQADKRAMAAKALGHLGKKAESASQALIAALDDKDIEVQTNAVAALGKIGDAAAANDGIKKIGRLLLHDLDEDIANGKREGVKKNAQLRRAALDTLVELKEHGRDALPALGEYATKIAVLEKSIDNEAAGSAREHLLLALKAIGNIVQDKNVKCDNAMVISLVNLFQREVVEGDTAKALGNLLEINNQKRSVVSGAVLDALRQMGPRALPALSAYLQSKRKRASPSTDALPLMGAVEAVIAVFPSEGLALDGALRKQLSTTLVGLRDEHKAWRRMLKGRPVAEVEAFDRMLSRIEEAFRLVNRIPDTKN